MQRKKKDASGKTLQSKVQRRCPQSLTDKQRLEGSKFRILNEKLYTSTSQTAREMFQTQPDLFDLMHRGFAAQAETWPVVPVDEAITWITQFHPPPAVIADMGCGDAKIQATVPNKVFSFDFKARNPSVVECDVRRTPLEAKSVDIVVFVLSLMGTNLGEFVAEAKRVVKDGGFLLIIEVVSRIENVELFVSSIESRGFKLHRRKDLTTFFIWLEFGTGLVAATPGPLILKPCLYKRR
jgi:ribosomal RNA-processing protein 8